VNLSTVPFEYLQNLVNAEILRQQSNALGINIQDEHIEAELRRQFVPTAATGQETDPGQLEREFRDNYSGYLTATGLSDADFRVIVEEKLAESALAGRLSEDIDLRQDHVEIRWIQLSVDGDILIGDVANRLANEDFARIAQELSVPSQFADPNGYVGWVPKGAFPDLDETIYGDESKGIPALSVGAVSEPIFTNEAYYLIKAISPAEERDLNNIMGHKLLQETVTAWQRENLLIGTQAGTVRMNFNSRLYDWVTDQVFVTAPRIDRPTPVPDLLPGVPGIQQGPGKGP
jgi:parvulin-like peptidyl-prolyl isomerase